MLRCQLTPSKLVHIHCPPPSGSTSAPIGWSITIVCSKGWKTWVTFSSVLKCKHLVTPAQSFHSANLHRIFAPFEVAKELTDSSCTSVVVTAVPVVWCLTWTGRFGLRYRLRSNAWNTKANGHEQVKQERRVQYWKAIGLSPLKRNWKLIKCLVSHLTDL